MHVGPAPMIYIRAHISDLSISTAEIFQKGGVLSKELFLRGAKQN
jgi:hypothetical protein